MVLVVGSTGFLGSEVVRRLRLTGEPVRALARETSNPERLESLRQAGAEIVFGDLKQPDTLRAACHGMDAIITTASSTLSRQPNDSIQTVDLDGYLSLIDVAAAAGVRRFIYTSIPPKTNESPLTLAKAKVAARLTASGMDYTILAANFFMEIWLSPMLGFDPENARATIYGSGQGPIGFVSYKDVAEIAVQSLRADACRNRTIAVAGPANVTPLDVVRVFEQASGRPFTVEHVPREALEARYRSASEPMDKTFAALMLDCATGCAMDMRPTLAILPMNLTTLEEYAGAMYPVIGAHD
jgi:uncharacterized protein YbjT (DUF2867 family)